MTLVWAVPCSGAHGQSSRLFLHQMWERFSALSLGAMAIPVMRPADSEPSPTGLGLLGPTAQVRGGPGSPQVVVRVVRWSGPRLQPSV